MPRRDLLKHSARLALAAAVAPASQCAQAQASTARSGIELTALYAQQSDEGVLLSYAVRFELSREVEQALSRGVAVVFAAQAELLRSRWYWMDQSRALATRRWRLGYQPLTRQWRLNVDGLSRHFAQLSEALDVVRKGTRWRIADAVSPGEEPDHHIEFSFKLDTDELPRPLQIGLGTSTGWDLSVQRRIQLAPISR
ncbi:uncharacterized protein DUF4390 [Aquabacterium commune]|jgi:hypothetical protein|uniref:Uncharacterized protein DUF4390 n=2 Tax=Burkholderiales genera incertae sedis TaxID=224471 RepID=A0A4R6RNW5_9BURK|nr:DUF4390 domain-containing protein [Aquabacterium sp.]TDP88441.1 uncharacterized protein DUF4390 [Aquabacterium commune]|tara:strand:+ start:242 stop:832 length:591 start_codon:yes stop_codon:yes gene_type:complete